MVTFKFSIHAECDAITNCSRKGVSTENSILYCNLQPCSDCAKLIISSKIKKVVYGDSYSIRRYEIVDKESYNKRLDNKEPVLVKFHSDNSKKMFQENNVELKYIDIYALMCELENSSGSTTTTEESGRFKGKANNSGNSFTGDGYFHLSKTIEQNL